MKDRIRQLLEMDGLNATEFSKKVKINASVVSNILNDKNQPSFDVIQKIIVAYPEVDVSWLMTGRGSIFSTDNEVFEQELTENQPAVTDESGSLFDAETLHLQQAQLSSMQGAQTENPLSRRENQIIATHVARTQEHGREKRSRMRQKSINLSDKEEIKLEKNSPKTVSKIIVLYEDNSFEEFYPNKA